MSNPNYFKTSCSRAGRSRKLGEKELEYSIEQKDLENKIISTQNLILFFTKIEEYHKIYFTKRATDTIMDYSDKYGFFDYQFDIINKLNEEFKHI